MSFVISFANGERLEGRQLEDARQCIDRIRHTGQAAVMLPAQIWEQPEPRRTTTGFVIPGSRLVEEHIQDGVLPVPADRPIDPPSVGVDRQLPYAIVIESCGAAEPWLVEGNVEQWVTFAGRDDYAWASLAEPILVPMAPHEPAIPARRVLVAARHPGSSLRSSTLPIHAHVCQPADGSDHGKGFSPGEILTSVWGIVSDSETR